MRLGKVRLLIQYTVDLDNQSMVDEAYDCINEDISNLIKYNEIADGIEVVEDPTAKEEDIPLSFLPDLEEDENE